MTILVCGNRTLPDDAIGVMRRRLAHLPDGSQVRLVHGGCRGADRLAHRLAQERGWLISEYPPDWKRYGLAAGPIRNQRMLDEGRPDKVWAFVERLSGGTFDMVQRARRAGIKTEVVDI